MKKEVESGKELLTIILKSLVDHPEDIEVSAEEGEKTTVYQVRCHQSDVGKILGKQGRNITAIRQIFTCFSAKEKMRCVIDIVN